MVNKSSQDSNHVAICPINLPKRTQVNQDSLSSKANFMSTVWSPVKYGWQFHESLVFRNGH